MTEEWMSLRQAALAAGVDRNTVSRWTKAKLLLTRTGKTRHLETTLVRLADVRKLAETRKPGRPKRTTKEAMRTKGNDDGEPGRPPKVRPEAKSKGKAKGKGKGNSTRSK